MHRSGTSLLASLLRAGGIFMGARRNNHDEALFFLHMNQRIFQLAHTRWDRPEPVRELLEIPAVRAATMDEIKRSVHSLRIVYYLGPSRFLRTRNLTTLTQPWGWKEPRTCYTLPIWLDMFPIANVIHISRHGVDVAQSLQQRERSRKRGMRNKLFSARCLSLEGAFTLWAEYEAMCLDVLEPIPPERKLQLRYEDLITAPREHLAEVLDFAGAPSTETILDKSPAVVESNRAFAFRRKPELMRFFKQSRGHSMLQRYGYDQV